MRSPVRFNPVFGTRSAVWPVLAAVLLGAAWLWSAAATSVGQVSDSEAVVIPFDFVSKFDGGKMGRQIGELVWARLRKRGRFVVPESMLDVREFLASQGIELSEDMSPEQMKPIVVDLFDAHVGIWGRVERAPGADFDVYDLEIWVVDYRHSPPRVVYHKKARTQSVSEIPHVYVREALDRLYGEQTPRPDQPVPVPAYSEGELGENLVDGTFDRGSDHPAGWEELPPHVLWLRDSSASANRFIRFDIPRSVAASTGVAYYSDWFPVKEGQKYWFRVRWRSFGPTAKVFVKCYDALPTRFRQRSADESRPPGVPSDYELREVYRAQMNLKGLRGQWNVHVEEFTPRHSRYTVRWGRVMLYGYWPEGRLDWDDVELRPVLVSSPSQSPTR